jgi:hypothetical protein
MAHGSSRGPHYAPAPRAEFFNELLTQDNSDKNQNPGLAQTEALRLPTSPAIRDPPRGLAVKCFWRAGNFCGNVSYTKTSE